MAQKQLSLQQQQKMVSESEALRLRRALTSKTGKTIYQIAQEAQHKRTKVRNPIEIAAKPKRTRTPVTAEVVYTNLDDNEADIYHKCIEQQIKYKDAVDKYTKLSNAHTLKGAGKAEHSKRYTAKLDWYTEELEYATKKVAEAKHEEDRLRNLARRRNSRKLKLLEQEAKQLLEEQMARKQKRAARRIAKEAKETKEDIVPVLVSAPEPEPEEGSEESDDQESEGSEEYGSEAGSESSSGYSTEEHQEYQESASSEPIIQPILQPIQQQQQPPALSEPQLSESTLEDDHIEVPLDPFQDQLGQPELEINALTPTFSMYPASQ